jgi:hypothetical protein
LAIEENAWFAGIDWFFLTFSSFRFFICISSLSASVVELVEMVDASENLSMGVATSAQKEEGQCG